MEKQIRNIAKFALSLKYKIMPITAGINAMLSSTGYANDMMPPNVDSVLFTMKKYDDSTVTKQPDGIATTYIHLEMNCFFDLIVNMKNIMMLMLLIMNATSAKDGNGFVSNIISFNDQICCAILYVNAKAANAYHAKIFLRSLRIW